MTDTYQKAKDCFEAGLFCAESVLQVIAEGEGIQSELIPGIASGFCGGVARTGNICGAVTGGVLGLNLVYGRRDSTESVEENYSAVQELISGFTEKFGSVNCRELLGCDLSTQEGQNYFKERGLRENCKEYTGVAAALVRAIIDRRRS